MHLIGDVVRVIKILKVVTATVLAMLGVIIALWLWYGPQSPVGRCAGVRWPSDATRFGVQLEDRVHSDGTRALYLTLLGKSEYLRYVLIKRLPVRFRGLEEGSVMALDYPPRAFISEPIDRHRKIDMDTSLELQPLPGWIDDRGRLPRELEGVFPVAGRSSVLQTIGRSATTGTHLSHKGNEHAVDIAAPIGTAVVAIRPGKVVHVRDGWPDFPCDKRGSLRWSTDNAVSIEDETGVMVIYGHLQNGSIAVRPGDRVIAGQGIAAVGRSGAGFTPAHLHIEAGGSIVDPKTDYWVSVPLRFRVCGEQGPARALVYKESISCPVP